MTEVKTSHITRKTVENAYTYEEYRELAERLLKEGKTTGENHSEAMLHYTKMNIHRMKRLDKQVELKEELAERCREIKRPMIWLILTEAWCGDAAQTIPAIQKIAGRSGRVQIRYLLRDQHLEIMDRFLTNGTSRSIPKLICLDSRTLDILGTWGPRPAEGQQMYDFLRSREELSGRERAEKLHKWYTDDKAGSIQDDFLELLDEWENA